MRPTPIRPSAAGPIGRGGRTAVLAVLLSGLPGACGGWTGGGPVCRTEAGPSALPESIDESSGVAVSRAHAGVHWTMNDGRTGVLYAVGASGEILDSVALAVPVRDWEDLELTPCGSGHCLWISDTGDNEAERDSVVVYRMAEPAPGGRSSPAGGTAPAIEAFPARFPDGARDVEALFVLPGDRVHLISKGGGSAPTLYRYPVPLTADSLVTLEEVQRLEDGPRALPRQITGASASEDGRLVVVRTYETLIFMTVEEGRLRPLDDGRTSLRTLSEGQGEAVAFGPGGEVVLTSEAGPLGGRGSITVLRCRLPDPAGDA